MNSWNLRGGLASTALIEENNLGDIVTLLTYAGTGCKRTCLVLGRIEELTVLSVAPSTRAAYKTRSIENIAHMRTDDFSPWRNTTVNTLMSKIYTHVQPTILTWSSVRVSAHLIA